MSDDILLLAGSAEAREIALGLVRTGRSVRAIMSEHPRGPNPMPVPFDVLQDLEEEHISQVIRGSRAMVDASHGFDAQMTAMGFAAATRAGVPFVTLSRPAWDLGQAADWLRARDVAEAMSLVAPGARVFSAAGWASLEHCRDFAGGVLMLRQTSLHDRPAPFDFVQLVFGVPPFDRASERALFKELAVDTLIARNLGGAPSRPKVDAAVDLGLRIILIDRPAMPPGAQVVEDVEAALEWVAAL